MKELSELKPLFESLTIRPTFDYVHIVLSLFIFGENPEGIGRYRLKDELQIGSGTAKSLVKKLKDVSEFIVVPDEGERRKGHVLTAKGHKFFTKVKRKIPLLEKADITFLKDIIIEPENVNPYFCLVKNATKKIKNGIEQRDAAIKVNGSGATCLVYNGKDIVFPSKFVNNSNDEQKKINQKQKYYLRKTM
jgi:DNA-binding MarR family transcriptional regulator